MEKTNLDKSNDKDFSTKFRDEFFKDKQAAEVRHKMMNYHYLQYKGILYLNKVYGQEYLQTIGLQVNVPRTFMTIESIRPQIIDKRLDIEAKAFNKKAQPYQSKARDMLVGEWDRSKSKWAKADAQTDALMFGTGYTLTKYVDDTIDTDIFDGYDEEGKPLTKKGTLTRYQGMKEIYLNPYHVFRDRTATTNEPGNSGSWGHCYVYSIWDFDVWKEVCEANEFDTEGMEKGGYLEEFDKVRRKIDTLYSYSEFRNKDNNGNVVTTLEGELEAPDWENAIMVVERFEEQSYSICSGANWTKNYAGKNPNPDKTIPISVFKDYSIPGEFEGVGEAEVIRWQQYEENKIHNLAYLQTLINTVQRYGIVKELLSDPTEVKMNNPLKPIYLKYVPNASINNAIQPLNQGRGTQYPAEFLKEIKTTGQSATGIPDGMIGTSKMATDTATEANILQNASLARINRKINEMEERDLVPTLERWLACIPHFYSDELDILITDNEDYYTKFIPYTREYNDNAKVVAEYATREGVQDPKVTTIEDVFLAKGYKNVVFVSDIINGFKISIKTVTGVAERKELIEQFREVIVDMDNANKVLVEMGQQPKYDTPKLREELLRQFPDIIQDPEDYILDQQTMVSEQPLVEENNLDNQMVPPPMGGA